MSRASGVRVVFETIGADDLPIAQLAEQGGAFDWLADGPDLYTAASAANGLKVKSVVRFDKLVTPPSRRSLLLRITCSLWRFDRIVQRTSLSTGDVGAIAHTEANLYRTVRNLALNWLRLKPCSAWSRSSVCME